MQDINNQTCPVASAEIEMTNDLVEQPDSEIQQHESYVKNTLTSELEIESTRLIEESPPNFTQYEVAVPFGCSEEQIEQALFKFVVDLLAP